MVTSSTQMAEIGTISRRIATYDQKVDADRDRFNTEMRREMWRYSLCAVLGAMLVFGGGVWGFLKATQYRTGHSLAHVVTVLPAGATIVVINPGSPAGR